MDVYSVCENGKSYIIWTLDNQNFLIFHVEKKITLRIASPLGISQNVFLLLILILEKFELSNCVCFKNKCTIISSLKMI